MILELTVKESDVLISVLTSAISEVREEIHRTDRYEYRDVLRDSKKIMESVLSKLALTPAPDQMQRESIH